MIGRKVYYSFCSKRYKRKVAFTWGHHVKNINNEYRHCKTITNPFEFRGRNGLHDGNISGLLPSEHPYWNILVCFQQNRRIKGIIDSINQLRHIPKAEQQVSDLRRSLQYIQDNFKFKIVA